MEIGNACSVCYGTGYDMQGLHCKCGAHQGWMRMDNNFYSMVQSLKDEITALKVQLSEQTELTELAKTTSQQFERMLHKQAETIGQLEKVILDHGLTMLNQIGLSGTEADALLSGTGYGDDDPAKIDWRKPLLTKVEVI